VQQYSRQYGMTIGSVISLNAYQAGGDDDNHMYSSQIVNNKSFNTTPFNTLRVTCRSDFQLTGSWVSYRCIVTVLSAAKKTLKTLTAYIDEAGPSDDIVSFDISGINQQVFIAIRFESTGHAGGTYASINKIEFLN